MLPCLLLHPCRFKNWHHVWILPYDFNFDSIRNWYLGPVPLISKYAVPLITSVPFEELVAMSFIWPIRLNGRTEYLKPHIGYQNIHDDAQDDNFWILGHFNYLGTPYQVKMCNWGKPKLQLLHRFGQIAHQNLWIWCLEPKFSLLTDLTYITPSLKTRIYLRKGKK